MSMKLEVLGQRMGQENLNIFNPAFDVTPVEYVSAVITERELYE